MRLRSLPALVLAVLPLSVQAGLVTYQFSGVVNQSGTSLPEWHPLEFGHGTAFTGSFTLDTDILPGAEAENVAFYYGVASNLQVRFGASGELGGFEQSDRPVFEGLPYTSVLYFLNDFAVDDASSYTFDQASLSLNLQALPGDSPNLLRYFNLNGFDFSSGLFDGLPASADFLLYSADSPSLWDVGFGGALYDDAGAQLAQYSFGGTLTQLQRVEVAVPEPATWSLMLAGLLGVSLLRRPRAATH